MKTYKVRPVLFSTKHQYDYQLILISSDDKIFEIGTVYYHTIYNHIATNRAIPNMDMFKAGCRKIIATQDKLSPELINKLIEEHNTIGMKDFEIKMEDGQDNDGKYSLRNEKRFQSNLTYDFVAIIKRNLFFILLH